ncbi:hypothetical protein OSB04_010806 [Centaurea solstitialis]|uniref:Uncharacterized protein n=1 Tax=Centaurea solstitialis TaxID=347529 RepID=A0AA38WCB6_9ASTR|nr:hypothetical protein OSB04_010806 [Centaurea solstitialis]
MKEIQGPDSLLLVGFHLLIIKIISLNCYGLKAKGKVDSSRDLLHKEMCLVLGLQETKAENFPFLGGQRNFGFLYTSAFGLAGGLLLSWDTGSFSKEQDTGGVNFCGAIGAWKNINKKVGLLNIYGPQFGAQKAYLLEELSSLILNAT